jgi:hypothetical protein
MNLNEEQKMAEKMRIYHESLDKFFENVEILKPKVAIPFADSYCIVGSNANLNKYMPHPAGMGDVVDAATDGSEFFGFESLATALIDDLLKS